VSLIVFQASLDLFSLRKGGIHLHLQGFALLRKLNGKLPCSPGIRVNLLRPGKAVNQNQKRVQGHPLAAVSRVGLTQGQRQEYKGCPLSVGSLYCSSKSRLRISGEATALPSQDH